MLRCMGCMAEIPEGNTTCPHCGYARGTPAREAYHLAPESILQGRYIIGRVLGYGGFGVTYIGWDASLERIVAVKEFLPSTFATRLPGNTTVSVYDGEATTQFSAGLQRFVSEAQTLAQFNGIPGIVDIYDSFAGNNTAYIIMQYLKGRDVKDMLAANGPLPYEQARDIILRVCDTLAPVHAKNIIHRDISPDNIYMTDTGEIKLLDFGAARYESAANSKSLSVILKAGYAPEEQYRSRGEQGPWTDVYALAATFYKMLTGQTPTDSMERAIRDELKEPSKAGAVLPQSADNAIMNALNVRKADRTQSVAAFKEALLADGVERVKVKQRSTGASRVPVAARVAIIVSVLFVVALGLYAAAGGFSGETIYIGGTKLEDTYGTAEREGYATVPRLAGLPQEEAQAALEELGLAMEVSGSTFSSGKPSMQVFSQEPAAGQQLELGGTVQVQIDVGGLLEAMDAGLATDVRGMAAGAATAYLRGREFQGPHYGLDFRYSDAAQNGLVTAVEYDTENDYYRVWVGCGPNDGANPFGEMRATMMREDGNIELALARPQTPNEDNEVYSQLGVTTTALLVSPGGGQSWTQIPFYDSYNARDAYISAETIADRRPQVNSIRYTEVLSAFFPQLAGQTLALQLERTHYSHYVYNSPGTAYDSLNLPLTFRFDYEGEAVQVDNVEPLDEATAKTLYDEGQFGDNHNAEWYFEEYYPAENPEYPSAYFFRLTGNFQVDKRYSIIGGFRCAELNFSCAQDGEALLAIDAGEFSPHENSASLGLLAPDQWAVYEDIYYEAQMDAEGNVQRTVPPATLITITNARIDEELAQQREEELWRLADSFVNATDAQREEMWAAMGEEEQAFIRDMTGWGL